MPFCFLLFFDFHEEYEKKSRKEKETPTESLFSLQTNFMQSEGEGFAVQQGSTMTVP